MNKILTLLLMMTTAISLAAPKKLKNIRLTTSNTVFISGAIDQQSVARAKRDLLDQVLKRGHSPYKIYIVLDSPGGSIDAGENFIRYAKTIPKVETISLFAASMAHAIVQALPGRRHVVEGGVMMAHRARGGVRGQINNGELESRLKLIKSIITRMEKRNANRIGISLAQYKSKVVNEWWTYDIGNVAEGVVDEMITISCTPQLSKKEKTIKVRSIFGNTSYKRSACPLL